MAAHLALKFAGYKPGIIIISPTRNFILDYKTLLPADDQFIIADTEDNSQKAAHKLNQFTTEYGLTISVQKTKSMVFNPLKPELNPICYLLALLGAHHFLHVSRIRVKLLTLR